MLKLFEPAKPKIELHIDQGFLQRLWDKHVPVSSDAYDRISLIYLKNVSPAESEAWKQINVTANITLQNMNILMNLQQNSMLVNKNVLENHIKYTTNHYLEQIRRSDYSAHKALIQYFSYIENSSQDNLRYEKWKKDLQIIRELEKEYKVLHNFSLQLKDLKTIQSIQIERELEKSLFESLEKKEYGMLRESFIWQEKKAVEKYIQQCNEIQYYELLERLEKKLTKEELISFTNLLEKREFQELYSKVFHEQYPGIVWKKTKEEFLQQLNYLDEKEIHQLWEKLEIYTENTLKENKESKSKRKMFRFRRRDNQLQLQTVSDFLSKVIEMKKSWMINMKERFEQDTFNKFSNDELQILTKNVDINELFIEEQEHQMFFQRISYTHNEIRRHLQSLKDIIMEERVKSVEKYQDVLELEDSYKSIYSESSEIRQQIEVMKNRSAIQKLWGRINQYIEEEDKKLIYREEQLYNENIVKLIRHAQSLNSEEYVLFVEKLAEEILEVQQIEEWKNAFMLYQRQRIERLSENRAPEIKMQLRETIRESEWIEHERKLDDNRIRLQKIFEYTNAYIEDEEQKLIYREEQIYNTSIQKMLEYAENLDEKEFDMFVCKLSHQAVTEEIYREEKEQIEEWKQVLFTYQKRNQREVSEKYVLDEERKSVETYISEEEKKLRENMTETEVIARETEFAKNRNTLQKVWEHINSYIEEEDQKLIYLEEQLYDHTIQRILEHVSKLKEEEYSTFVQKLSEQITRKDQIEEWKQVLRICQKRNQREVSEKYVLDEERKFVETYISEEEKKLRENMTETEVIARETEFAKNRNTLQKVWEHINSYIEEEDQKLIYVEEQLYDHTIQRILEHVSKLKEEEYSTFVKKLSEQMTKKNQNLITKEQQSLLIKENLTSQIQKEVTEEFQQTENKQIEEWKQVLRTYQKRNQQEVSEKYVLDEERKSVETYISEEEKKLRENMTETEVIARETEFAKNRNTLQKVWEHINSYIEEEDQKLIYVEEQLYDHTIQRILEHVSKLKEEEYSTFVKKLSEQMTKKDQNLITKEEQSLLIKENLTSQIQKEVTEEFQQAENKQIEEWKQVLRTYQKRNQREVSEKYVLDEERKFSEKYISEEEKKLRENMTETEVIAREIEFAKNRNTLQKVLEHVNSYIEEEDQKLIYLEEQLYDRTILNFLEHVNELKEEEYNVLIQKLIEQIKQQNQRMIEKASLNNQVQQTLTEEVFFEANDQIEDWKQMLRTYQKRNQKDNSENKISKEERKLRESMTETEVAIREAELTKDRKILKKVLEHVNLYIEEEDHKLIYQEEQLYDDSIRCFLKYVNGLEEEEYKIFVQNLSEQIVKQEQIQKIEKWNNVLLAYQKKNQNNVFESQDLEEVIEITGNITETDFIMHQIELAKNRNELRKILEYVNYYIEEEDQKLIYREEQLYNASLKELLEYVNELSEEEYSVFIHNLSERITKENQYQQIKEWKNILLSYQKQAQKDVAESHTVKEMFGHINSYIEEEDQRLVYQEEQLIEKIQNSIIPLIKKTTVKENNEENRTQQEAVKFLKNEEYRKIAKSFPKLVHNIMQYEEQRMDVQEEKLHELEKVHSVIDTRKERLVNLTRKEQSDLIQNEQFMFLQKEEERLLNNNLTYSTEADILYEKSAETLGLAKGINELKYEELKYAIREELRNEAQNQTKTEIRIRQEREQMEAVQKKLDKRLKEVESQLQKVEDKENAKEDVRSIAEQVKKQLHEELHMEKLRRGIW